MHTGNVQRFGFIILLIQCRILPAADCEKTNSCFSSNVLQDAGASPNSTVRESIANTLFSLEQATSSLPSALANPASYGSGPIVESGELSSSSRNQASTAMQTPAVRGRILDQLYSSMLPNLPAYSPTLGDPLISIEYSNSVTGMFGWLELNVHKGPTNISDASFNPKFPPIGPVAFSLKIGADLSIQAWSFNVSDPTGFFIGASIGSDMIEAPNISGSVNVFNLKRSARFQPGPGAYNTAGELTRAISALYGGCFSSIEFCQ